MPQGCARRPCHGALLPTASSLRARSCFLRLSSEWILSDRNNRGCRAWCVLSSPGTVAGDYEAAEPWRLRQEQESHLDLNLSISEADRCIAAPATLTDEKERRLFSKHRGLICGDEESKLREQAITRQERLEAEVKQASSGLVSQVSVIGGLKLRLGDQGRRVLESLSAVTMKEDEIKRMRNEFAKRSERAAMISGEIRSRVLLLHQANELIDEQEHEVERLWESVRRKEEEVEASLLLRKEKEGELKAAESFLEERTREWLLALEELKQLVNEMSGWVIDSDKAAVKGIRMLSRLVVDVRAELVRSWRSLASLKQKLEDDVHKKVLFERTRELEEEKESLASHTASLKDGRKLVQTKRIPLAVAEAQHEELNRELAVEQRLIEELQEHLVGERVHLELVARDVSLLQAELDGKTVEYLETRELLRVKELKLMEAKLEIQHLDSEHHALRGMLEDDTCNLPGMG